ncbi:Clp protease ClpP [Clostridium tetani]|uniref:head maturation protease n=1 Tax=Clostridium phage phiCT19406C TaxID=1567011 RepID=UPI000512B82C|nr:head maturation protease, ClpP-related [Clostridium tetani]YP_009218066.1 head maturation protease [Clostridium phage phiCT19406C]AJA42860.1 prohead Clp protease [Clostridium phage phiCT19406C]KGI44658.1 Clp protease [Clostridium tetani]KHO30853.1 Clp protease [Clostridium tetani]RXI57491.1 Clp protease ClpP [Clostridium tetani]RXI62333.1 Clp protease ClpP [Clostridium tetani]
MNKFYEFKNKANVIDIYVYGEIVSGSDKWDESDVTFNDFKDNLEGLTGNETINMYINSCGGSVIATQGILAMLQRAKDKGVTINATIDGLGASCASFLPLVANNVYAYNSSMLMIHKPFTFAMGNADELQEQAEILNKIENSVMMPLYMSKVKEGITEDYIKDLVRKETWLNAKEMSNIFNIEILEDDKELVACVKDKSILNNYKNIPEQLKNKLTDKDKQQTTDELELAKAKLKLELL